MTKNLFSVGGDGLHTYIQYSDGSRTHLTQENHAWAVHTINKLIRWLASGNGATNKTVENMNENES